MKKVLFALSLMVMVGMQALLAQTTNITGKVTDASDGSAIPGVSVFVKGTTVGTVTRPDGTYTLTVPNDATTLVFSFVGMTTQEVAIAGKTVINAAMSSDAMDIDEVMVVAYGTTTKKSFTGTAAKVDAERIESKNASNVSQALAGEVAGVQVISDNGQPGSQAKIRIRGIGSINGSRDPLYIVDGAPLQGDINSISPSDIESTTVLKDASATAIYGSRGANGVVIITTKKGKSGKSNIEVDLKYGVNMRLLPDYDVYTNPEEYVETAWSALKTRGYLSGYGDQAADYANTYLFTDVSGTPGFDPIYNMWNVDGDMLIDPATGKFKSGIERRYSPEKWSDEIFQSAKRTELGVRLDGGNETTTFYSSFNMLDDQGYYLNSDFTRFTGRLNVDHKIRKWLKGSMNMSFMNSESNTGGGQDTDSNNGFWLVSNMPPLYTVYGRDADGNKIADDLLGGYVFDFGDGTYGKRRFASLTNAVATSTYDVNRSITNQFTGNSMLEATFLKHFTLSSRFNLEYVTDSYDNLGNAFYGGSAEQGGSIYKRKREWFAFTTTNMLRYANEFGDHHVNAFIGQEASSVEFKNLSGFKSNLADPFGLEFNNAVVSSPAGSYMTELMLESYFGNVTYDFANKYFFNGTIRRDGSSKFINEKWGTFGSVGLGWMVSNESFMESVKSILPELKVKASYGVSGEQGGIGIYSSHDLYSVDNLNDNISLSFSSKGNPDLTWEESKQFQVGTEFNLFHRIDGSVDYYVKKTGNLLFSKRVPPSKGYAIIQVNDGEMTNKGLEVVLNANIVKTNDLTVDFGINAAFESNEITKMPIDDGTGKQKVIDVDGVYGRSVGHSLLDIYTREYAGVNPDNGASQWNMYYNDINGDGSFTEGTDKIITDMVTYMAENTDAKVEKDITETYANATRKYIDKSPIPTVRGSFNFDIDYKGIQLTALFSYGLGGYGIDGNYQDLMGDALVGSNNWHKDVANAWKQPGDITDVPAITSGAAGAAYGNINYSQANSTSDRFVTSSNYLALNNIVLSYNFRKPVLDKLHLKGLKLFVSGDNLWVGTKRKGYFPNYSEVGASSRYQYVPLSSITGGINVKF